VLAAFLQPAVERVSPHVLARFLHRGATSSISMHSKSFWLCLLLSDGEQQGVAVIKHASCWRTWPLFLNAVHQPTT
jgi:hypothetical protein